jgi:glycosyltransferase involved in cell wall biosynthesis
MSQAIPSFSIILPVHDNAGTVVASLASIESALAYLAERCAGPVSGQVVVIDDASTDGSVTAFEGFVGDKANYQLVRRPTSGGAGAARNSGVARATGELLFFLDADDTYLPPHLAVCCERMRDPTIDFVKTRVRMSDPVHADWQERIENSLVQNLCIRRRCHDFVGGFPDWHLFRRQDDQFHHVLAINRKTDDVFYNDLIFRLLKGVKIDVVTVEYIRYPGNALDRQYEKFSRSPSEEKPGSVPDHERFRLHLAHTLTENRFRNLRGQRPS